MATIVADSASRTDVLAAYNTADPGDTVSIPTGSATWSSTITISKAITIQGAGGTSTVLTSSIGSGGSVLTVELASDLAVRITGIGFLLGTMNNGRQAIGVFGDRTGGYALTQIRIDNNHVTGGGSGAIYLDGWINGVIDHNAFLNNYEAINYRGDDNQVWARAFSNGISAGTSDALFIEDNSFVLNNSSTVVVDAEIYLQEGASVVARYNTFDSTAFTDVSFMTFLLNNHGNQEYINGTLGTNFRGQPIFEFYNNTAHVNKTDEFIGIRGGSVLIYNNDFVADTGSPSTIQFSEEESWQDAFFSPLRTVWPAQDQMFNSFVWNNTYNGNPITAISLDESQDATFIQENRDYFMHAPQASGGKSSFTGTRAGGSTTAPTTSDTGSMTFSSSGANAYYPYTPYTYPHPLRGEAATRPLHGSNTLLSIHL